MAKILIVDDHPAICFALKVSLEQSADFQVTTSDGERLLLHIRDRQPELVILDIELAACDGMDMLPRLKQHHPRLKIIILTSQPAHLYARRALLAGADGYLSKSAPLAALSSLCQLVLNGYQCFPASALAALRDASGRESQDLLARLSDREMTVLRYLHQGKSPKEIATILQVSNKTISTYKSRMLEKSGQPDLQPLFALLNQPESHR